VSYSLDDLKLTPERQAQLQAALASLHSADPLQDCLDQAYEEVRIYCTGYTIPETLQRRWISALALSFAFGRIEGGAPQDIKAAADAALTELRAISEGKRPNFPREAVSNPDQGSWGSQADIFATPTS
jgi:hypothetical protein